MENTVIFLPIMLYSVIGAFLFYTKKINFNNQLVILTIALISHIIISIMAGSWLWTIGQIIVALLSFVLLVFFFAGKTSGETMLTMSSIIALAPIPQGLIPIALTFILLIISAFISMRKDRGAFKVALIDATLSTGLSYNKPDYSHLPERSELDPNTKRTSLLPYTAIVMSLAALYYFLQPLLLES